MPASTVHCATVPALMIIGKVSFDELDLPGVYRVAQKILGRDFRSLSNRAVTVRSHLGPGANTRGRRIMQKRLAELGRFLRDYYSPSNKPKVKLNLTPLNEKSLAKI